MEQSHPFMIYTFGKLDILLDGQSIFTGRKRQPKYLRLLWYLIVHQKRGFTAEKLVDELFPNADIIDAQNYIRIMIHRLRYMIAGKNSLAKDLSSFIRITMQNGSYQVDLSPSALCDFIHMDELCNMKDKSQRTMNDLMELYTGEFMAAMPDEQWTGPLKGYYKRLFHSSAVEILEQYRTDGNLDLLISNCEKCLQVDELDQEINLIFCVDFYWWAGLEKRLYIMVISRKECIMS